MKNTKTKFTTVMIMLVMVLLSAIIGLGGLSVKAFADGDGPGVAVPTDPDPDNGGDGGDEFTSIYYLSDSEPILSEQTLMEEFETADVEQVRYDFEYSEEFTALYYSGEFSNIKAEIVIIQFTRIMPNPDILEQFFSDLQSRGCKVVFVSGYSLGSFSSLGFMNYVDEFMKCCSGSFERYITYSVIDMYYNGLGENSCILVDGRFITIEEEHFVDGRLDLQKLCDSSWFLRTLLEQLYIYLDLTCDSIDYEEIAEKLSEMGISILVNTESNTYYDLFFPYNKYENIEYFYNLMEVLPNGNYLNYFAMGWWRLQEDFYRLLIEAQDNLGEDHVPVYIWDFDPDDYDEDGLKIITFESLCGLYDGDFANYEKERLLDILRALIS